MNAIPRLTVLRKGLPALAVAGALFLGVGAAHAQAPGEMRGLLGVGDGPSGPVNPGKPATEQPKPPSGQPAEKKPDNPQKPGDPGTGPAKPQPPKDEPQIDKQAIRATLDASSTTEILPEKKAIEVRKAGRLLVRTASDPNTGKQIPVYRPVVKQVGDAGSGAEKVILLEMGPEFIE